MLRCRGWWWVLLEELPHRKSRRPRIVAPADQVPGIVRRRLRPVRRRMGGEQAWDAHAGLRAGAWGVGRVGSISGQVADARYRPHSHTERRSLVLAGALKSATWPARVRAAGAARAWTGGSPGTTAGDRAKTAAGSLAPALIPCAQVTRGPAREKRWPKPNETSLIGNNSLIASGQCSEVSAENQVVS